MEFTHRPLQLGETIAAIATPPGEGGISIVRLSGKEAIAIASRLFSKSLDQCASHTIHFGILSDLDGHRLDEVLALLFRAPRSYTGEDTVEFHCHGGTIASRKALDALLAAGARLASPGEFTFRAFMHGKIDLSQAESIQELISAKSEAAFAVAGAHLQGGLSEKIHAFQKELLRLAAILEAAVDFPEEGLAFASPAEVAHDLDLLHKEIASLLATFHDGQKLAQGIALCIAGAPNVGKSSLMNALLERERAIVTPIPGTTRDLLEELLILEGLPFRLIDTAGIHPTEDIVEKEGIRRSKEAFSHADLILLVLDHARPLTAAEEELCALLPQEKTLLLWNKIDLPGQADRSLPHPHQLKISVKEKRGLDAVKKYLHALAWERGSVPQEPPLLLTKARHAEALQKTAERLLVVKEGILRGESPEWLSADLKEALSHLGAILGTNVTDTLLSTIFSQFCIGK